MSTEERLELTPRPRPEQVPTQAPYSNATFTYSNIETDITICFLRLPLINDEQVQQLRDESANKVDATVVASVTLPREVALGLATRLISILNKSPDT